MQGQPRLKFVGTPEPTSGIKFTPVSKMAQLWQENKPNKDGKTFQEAILELERRLGSVFEWRKVLHSSQSKNKSEKVHRILTNDDTVQYYYNEKLKRFKKEQEIT